MGLFGPSPSISRVDARTKLQQFLQAKGCRDWAIQRGQGQYATKRVTGASATAPAGVAAWQRA